MNKIIYGFCVLLFLGTCDTVQAKVSPRKIRKYISTTDTNALRHLIENEMDINEVVKKGNRLIHYATYAENLNVIKWLVAGGADLDVQNKWSYTPLMKATSMYGGNDEIANFLILSCANPNITGNHGTTALRTSIVDFKPELFKTLVKHGADVNFYCNQCCDQSIFHYACKYGTKETIELLIKSNVDYKHVDCNNYCGIHYAIWLENTEVIRTLTELKIDVTSEKCNKDKILEYLNTAELDIEVVKVTMDYIRFLK